MCFLRSNNMIVDNNAAADDYVFSLTFIYLFYAMRQTSVGVETHLSKCYSQTNSRENCTFYNCCTKYPRTAISGTTFIRELLPLSYLFRTEVGRFNNYWKWWKWRSTPDQTCDYGALVYSNYETRGQRLPYTYSREGLNVSTVRLMEW